MATTIETELSKILDKIDSRLERLESGQADMKAALATLDQKVTDTGKRLDSIEARVGGLTGWIIGILFALVGGLLGLLGKVTFFPNP
ncbi:MAG: hypothetical protein GC158_13960 [Cyanobacteria bacterium RI_101]|nr:hypothetical protein [Cyanobacteria bacterium RI_101]